MSLRIPSLHLLLLAATATACSSTSTSPPAATADASADVTADTATPPVPDAAPPDDARLPPDVLVSDASTACQNMLAMVEGLQPAAQACTPGAPNACKGEVMGICCPVTVDFSTNQDAINEFATAATGYVSECHINCGAVSCPKDVPSGSCVAGATSGVCM